MIKIRKKVPIVIFILKFCQYSSLNNYSQTLQTKRFNLKIKKMKFYCQELKVLQSICSVTQLNRIKMTKNKILKIMLIVIGVVILIGGGVGFYMFNNLPHSSLTSIIYICSRAMISGYLLDVVLSYLTLVCSRRIR